MKICGITIDPQKLMPKAELLAFLRKNGGDDRALAYIRDKYINIFSNELIWRYPISDGKYLGIFIVPVKEGYISLPYDLVDRDDGELLELDGVAMFDAEAMQCLIEDWCSFSGGLLCAMTDMLRVLRGE